MTQTRSIIVEEVLPHPPEKVWKALTTSDFIAAWLMPNDFMPEVGRPFIFTTRPIGDWDGVVHCEVTECLPYERLSYTWRGGADSGTHPGKLDTLVTWQLTPVENGTRLRMEHAGFKLPENDFAFDGMSPGWGRVMNSINRVIAEKG